MAGFEPGAAPPAPNGATPPDPAPQAEQDQVTIEMTNALKAVAQQVTMLGQMVQALQANLAAPAEIIRDENNQPIAVRKAGKIQQIVRDESGVAIGTVPMPNR